MRCFRLARPLAAAALALCLALPLAGCRDLEDWLRSGQPLPPHLADLVDLADPAGPKADPAKPGPKEKDEKPGKADPKPAKPDPGPGKTKP